MAISYIGSARSDSASATSRSVTPHASTAEGDMVLALVWYYGTGTWDFAAPGSWTLLGSHTNGSIKQALYWQVSPVGGIGSTTFGNFSSAAKIAVLLATYRAAFIVAGPIGNFSNTEYVVADTTVRAAGITVGKHDPVVFFGTNNYSTACTYTPPTSFTEDYDASDANSKASLEAAHYVFPAAGATGDMDATASEVAWAARKHAFAVQLHRIWRRVTGATVQSATVVDVQFDAAVDQTTANDETKWTITKDGGGSVPTYTCTRQADTSVVQIVFDSSLAGSYTIEATSVLDSDGYDLDPANDSASAQVLPPGGGLRAQAWMLG